MAMASAEKLAHTLAEAPIDAALALHEASMRPSIERLQGRAKRSAAMFIPSLADRLPLAQRRDPSRTATLARPLPFQFHPRRSDIGAIGFER